MKHQQQQQQSRRSEKLQEHTDRFQGIIQANLDRLRHFGKLTLQQLFSCNPVRAQFGQFGHNFMSRYWPRLSAEVQDEILHIAEPALQDAKPQQAKAEHEPKRHVGECPLPDDLPRPRLPKSLRQLYGNSEAKRPSSV